MCLASIETYIWIRSIMIMTPSHLPDHHWYSRDRNHGCGQGAARWRIDILATEITGAAKVWHVDGFLRACRILNDVPYWPTMEELYSIVLFKRFTYEFLVLRLRLSLKYSQPKVMRGCGCGTLAYSLDSAGIGLSLDARRSLLCYDCMNS